MKRLTLLVMPLMTLSLLASCNKGGGDKPGPKPEKGGLCLTAEEDNSTLGYLKDENVDVNIEISKDEITWTNWDGTDISLNKDEKIYVRNTKNMLSKTDAIFSFTMSTGKIAASGNMMSMINYADLSECCFDSAFLDCITLTSAPTLPATTLAPDCYRSMFSGCKSLTVAPILPATTLSSHCYDTMFYECDNLLSSPSLSATTLAPYCYDRMFDECNKLSSPPTLPASQLAEGCYRRMFMSSGLLSAPNLPATTLVKNCYNRMFDCCQLLKINENNGTKIFTCPSEIPSNAVSDMFNNTGGTFTGTPTAGNTYYWY